MLRFSSKWRAASAPRGQGWDVVEAFKARFANAGNGYAGRSSSWDFAEYDLGERMQEAAANAPKFLEAFYDGCEQVRSTVSELTVPDADFINAVCEKYDIGFIVDPPDLKLRDDIRVVSVTPTSLLDNAHRELREADDRARDLLQEGRGREAVQSSLYLLESVSTAFNQIGVKGKYFNKIVSELKTSSHGTMLARVLDWIEQLHGYLSAPKGGGVRHGLDINATPSSCTKRSSAATSFTAT